MKNLVKKVLLPNSEVNPTQHNSECAKQVMVELLRFNNQLGNHPQGRQLFTLLSLKLAKDGLLSGFGGLQITA